MTNTSSFDFVFYIGYRLAQLLSEETKLTAELWFQLSQLMFYLYSCTCFIYSYSSEVKCHIADLSHRLFSVYM